MRLSRPYKEYYLYSDRNEPRIGDWVLVPFFGRKKQLPYIIVTQEDLNLTKSSEYKAEILLASTEKLEGLPLLDKSKLEALIALNNIRTELLKEYPIKIEANGGWGTEMDVNEDIRNTAIKYYEKGLNKILDWVNGHYRTYAMIPVETEAEIVFGEVQRKIESLLGIESHWEVEIETETIHADRAPNGFEILPLIDNGYINITCVKIE